MSNLPLAVQIILEIAALIVGVWLLVKCGNCFVEAARVIARKLGVSPLVIGLTVVAIGTSLPELAVSVSDAITCLVSTSADNANVALGNVVGSNICNLLIVLGLSVVFTPIIVNKRVCTKEFPILLVVSALVVIFVCFFGENLVVQRWEAAILVALLVAYLVFIVVDAKRQAAKTAPVTTEVTPEKTMSWGKIICLLLIGIAGIAGGGELVVFGAKGLALQGAEALHLNRDLTEALVGLTIVAVGTSLPELVVSAMAAKHGQNDIALGNVIGSNIINSLFVLGVAGVVTPLTSGAQIIVDVLVMLWAAILVYLFSLSGKLQRWHGFLLLAGYVGYVSYLIVRTVVA